MTPQNRRRFTLALNGLLRATVQARFPYDTRGRFSARLANKFQREKQRRKDHVYDVVERIAHEP
jgi:hypothetical protein